MQQKNIKSLQQDSALLKQELSESSTREHKLLTENDPINQPPFYQNKNISCKNWQDNTPDWKTYTNNEYGFTFTYPGTGIQISNYQAVDCSIDSVSYPAKASAADGYVNPEKMRLLYFPYIISISDNDSGTSVCDDFKNSPFQNPQYFYPQVNADESCAVKYNDSLYLARYRKGKTILSISGVQNSNSNFDCTPISEYDFTICSTAKDSPAYCKISNEIRAKQSLYTDWDITKSIHFF